MTLNELVNVFLPTFAGDDDNERKNAMQAAAITWYAANYVALGMPRINTINAKLFLYLQTL